MQQQKDNSTCPHCPDGHENPWKRVWTVTVGSTRDHDGQPTQLIVMKNGYQHVSESDAQWLWQLIRNAKSKRAIMNEQQEG